jgi:single-strand DNA-binding protein
MYGYSKVLVIGHLIRDPKLHTTPSGTVIAKFTLAVTRKRLREQAPVEGTSSIEITAFNKHAQSIAEHLKPGRPLFVEGHLQEYRWEDPEGKHRSRLDVILDQFAFLDPRHPPHVDDPLPALEPGAATR